MSAVFRPIARGIMNTNLAAHGDVGPGPARVALLEMQRRAGEVPELPKPPPAPPAPPDLSDLAVRAARAAELRRGRRLGYGSTVLTGPLGAPGRASVAGRSLLGG